MRGGTGRLPGRDNRELKHVGRQHDDDGQNRFLQINILLT